MKERRLILDRQLSQLEVEKAGIEHGINEIHRRFALLDEVESWGLLVTEESSTDYHSGGSRHDGYDNQDNNRDREEAVGLVRAGYF